MLPEGIVSTGWPAVRDKCAEFGDSFDEWQDGAGRATLAKRVDDKYAATIDGVTWSIPRQVAKTFLVGRIVVALCVLFPGLTVLWTAHHGRTTTRTFRSLQGFVKRKKVWPHILSVRTANGEQEIAFRNGSLIMFGAREQGFGRGFEEVDVEVFDEAQILTEKALEDMVAATNQSKHPHGALLFYMGTPPRPGDPSEAFTAKRSKALAGKMRDGVYIECSADADADPDDRKQWAKANPSYPLRTPDESMQRLRANLPSVDAWKREALGIWDETAAATPFAAAWKARRGDAPDDPPAAFALDMTWDREWTSLAAIAGSYVDIVEHHHGATWVVEACQKLQKVHDVPVLVLSKGPAAPLIAPLREAGVHVREVAGEDYQRACGSLHDAVTGEALTHSGHPALDAAVAGAVVSGGSAGWVWDRKKGAVISPLVAATLAWLARSQGEPRVRSL